MRRARSRRSATSPRVRRKVTNLCMAQRYGEHAGTLVLNLRASRLRGLDAQDELRSRARVRVRERGSWW